MTEPGERLPWRPDPLGAAVLLVLTAIAGSLDAVAFVSLGGTFVGNQTGTVLLLVMGATDRAPVETGAAAASLGSFIVGAALAGRVLPTTAPGRPWPQHTRTVLLVEVALIASGAALSAIDDIHSAAVVAPIALAMGLQAGLARRVALPYLTAAFITGATTDGAMKSPLGDRSTRWWWLAGMPILALVVGAAIGAFLRHRGHRSCAVGHRDVHCRRLGTHDDPPARTCRAARRGRSSRHRRRPTPRIERVTASAGSSPAYSPLAWRSLSTCAGCASGSDTNSCFCRP